MNDPSEKELALADETEKSASGEPTPSEPSPVSGPEALSEPEAKKPAFEVKFGEDAFDDFGEMVPTEPVPAGPDPFAAPEGTTEKKSWSRIKVGVTIGLLVLVALFCTAVIFCLSDMMGGSGSEDSVTITVEPNTGLNKISETLKEAGVIDYPDVFKFYVKYMADGASTIQFGEFELNASMSYGEIISALSTYNRSDQVVEVTIPEGFTVVEIAARLEAGKVCTAEDFYAAVNQTGYSYSFLDEEALSASNRYFKLEGYLYPDTYEFFINEKAEDVVEKMLDNFADHYTSKIRKAVEQSGMSLDQVVTLASIVQAEASGNAEQMANVSSVYHNRLGNSDTYPKLQSDPTILYAENVLKPFFLEDDGAVSDAEQAILDSYNTYAGSGLPAGAINNPSADAILAAAQPAETDYTYFVSSSDGVTFLYANNYRAHLANCEELGISG